MENKDLIHKKINKYMNLALSEALKAYSKKEVPIGAVIVSSDNKILAKAYNLVESKKNPLCHAEILAIEKACKKINEKYLMGASIFVTLEPCPMCAMAISLAKIKNVYFASLDKKGGAVINGIKLYDSASNLFKPNVFYGIKDEEASKLLKNFFQELRKNIKSTCK